MGMFQKATKKQARLRMAIAGPSGSGKTYSALRIGTAMADRVAVIDTEHGSASKYADKFDFFTVSLQPPYSPERFIERIEAAEQEGFDLVVIDSLSHAWKGEGGILEIVDKEKKKQKGGGSFSAWGEATPRHRALIDSMLSSTVHIIATMRSKQEYVMVEKDNGKKGVEKRGMSPVQRDNVEYEFDVFADMDMEHNMLVSKSRFDELADEVIELPGEAVAARLNDWLSDGEPSEREKAINDLEDALDEVGASPERRQNSKNWAATQKSPDSIRNAAKALRSEARKDEPSGDGAPQPETNEDKAESDTSRKATGVGQASTTPSNSPPHAQDSRQQDTENTEAAPPNGSAETNEGTPLPESISGRNFLIEAGISNVEDLRRIVESNEQSLEDLDGIGSVTAKAARQWVEENA